MSGRRYRVVVIGTSAGGLQALGRLLPALPADFPLPLVVVQHLHPTAGDFLADSLDAKCRLHVVQAEEKAPLRPGRVYLAPANYHLLIEPDHTLALSLEGPVHFARPSVDVLFESAVEAYGAAVIGVVLTGANVDGAAGLALIKAAGGYAIVQEPAEAEASAMPAAAIAAAATVDRILPLAAIAEQLVEVTRWGEDVPPHGR